MPSRRTWRVTGQVQGVGFRPFVYRLATELGLAGSVRNDPRGVTIDALGPPAELEALLRRLRAEAPTLAVIDEVHETSERPGASPEGGAFHIVQSDHSSAERGRVTVDSAVCADCRTELRDPSDRRHRHALVNCTNCGPRYTIIRDLPYDRPLTTMADFAMCAACESEYRDPGNRRFHAQPTCCPACGPRLVLQGKGGGPVDADPIRSAAQILGDGGILAMKGLGGFHLVVDAGNEEAVRRLRDGKRRDEKPFAVMVPDLESARALADLSAEAEVLLDSPERPIVLAARRPGGPGDLAPGVAPANHRLGLMLPYTPMQHLLLDEVRRTLVMTSANESDDPLITHDIEAVALPFVDATLCHDRAIERAVDDSIFIDTSAGLRPVRRARGYVPLPLPLPLEARSPGLCVGGELKNTVAVVRGAHAILGQHVGDLTYARAYERFRRTIRDLERLFDVVPRWIACDAHPDYLSHRWAREEAEARGLELIVVQHHHAHLASVLAEHGRTAPTLALVCDGVGYGADGTAWGGEVLLGDLAGFRRLGHLRPLSLPGGDQAARETGRPALAWLFDLLGERAVEQPEAAVALPDEARRRAVAALLARDVSCPRSSGLGRLFDAAAALLGICLENRHEAMSGMRLEAAASTSVERPSGDGLVLLREGALGDAPAPFELDTRPLLEAILTDLRSHRKIPDVAWRFHDAIADGLSRAARRAADETGIGTVALSGGVFLNALLTERVLGHLGAGGIEVLLHGVVPPNDGGIAYGQAAVAACRTNDSCADESFRRERSSA